MDILSKIDYVLILSITVTPNASFASRCHQICSQHWVNGIIKRGFIDWKNFTGSCLIVFEDNIRLNAKLSYVGLVSSPNDTLLSVTTNL